MLLLSGTERIRLTIWKEQLLFLKSIYSSQIGRGQWPRSSNHSSFNFQYVIHEHSEHYTIMRKWILTWILPTLLYSSCFHIICLVGTISLACNDMTSEQMATNVNCSSPERHTRSYDYMEGGDIRVRRLFCRTQWYLRIDKRGKVKGTQEMKNNYSK